MDVNTPRVPRDGHEERRPRSFIASEAWRLPQESNLFITATNLIQHHPASRPSLLPIHNTQDESNHGISKDADTFIAGGGIVSFPRSVEDSTMLRG